MKTEEIRHHLDEIAVYGKAITQHVLRELARFDSAREEAHAKLVEARDLRDALRSELPPELFALAESQVEFAAELSAAQVQVGLIHFKALDLQLKLLMSLMRKTAEGATEDEAANWALIRALLGATIGVLGIFAATPAVVAAGIGMNVVEVYKGLKNKEEEGARLDRLLAQRATDAAVSQVFAFNRSSLVEVDRLLSEGPIAKYSQRDILMRPIEEWLARWRPAPN